MVVPMTTRGEKATEKPSAGKKEAGTVRPVQKPGQARLAPEDEEEVRAKTPVKLIAQSVRGMEDVLPEQQGYWDVIADTVQRVCTSFNMKRIATPLVEEAVLFARSMGEETAVIEKEMYFIRDRGDGVKLALRPEFTAGIVRAYLEHGLASRPQPVRLWYSGTLFRHDRPQAGRYRQFSQFGMEVIGDGHPITDVQIIHAAYEIYRSLQLDAFRIEINTIGCLKSTCRPAYLATLKGHAQEHVRKLCADCRRRLKVNPLRLLDCKEEKCQLVANTAPKLGDHLCEECFEHRAQVLTYLGELSIPVKENTRLVRGLDYYTRTVFEVVPTLASWDGVEPSAIGGGGRYDGLVQLLGGPATPAVGFSGGIERTILQMRAEGVEVNVSEMPDVFLTHLGDLGRRKCLKLFDELRRAGFRIAEAFHKEGIKAQLRVADRLHTSWALILGQKEALDNTVILRNMESGVQETLDANLDALIPALKKRLRREYPSGDQQRP